MNRGYNNEEGSLKKPCSKDEAQPTVLEELAGPDGAGLQVPQGEDIPPDAGKREMLLQLEV